VVVPSEHPDAAFGMLILEREELVDMSDGNIMAVATVLLETGMVPMEEPFTEFLMETAAGLVGLRCNVRDGRSSTPRSPAQPSRGAGDHPHGRRPGLDHRDVAARRPSHGSVSGRLLARGAGRREGRDPDLTPAARSERVSVGGAAAGSR
jgi:hypothetical protein